VASEKVDRLEPTSRFNGGAGRDSIRKGNGESGIYRYLRAQNYLNAEAGYRQRTGEETR
jgi:hypothetical protein